MTRQIIFHFDIVYQHIGLNNTHDTSHDLIMERGLQRVNKDFVSQNFWRQRKLFEQTFAYTDNRRAAGLSVYIAAEKTCIVCKCRHID